MKIKFLTESFLSQEIKQDFEISRYSAVVVDETIERSTFTDILLLDLTCVVFRLPWRCRFKARQASGRSSPPSKLIIMSATLQVSDFAENPGLWRTALCFSLQPVIHVESFQFLLFCHFAIVTGADYRKAGSPNIDPNPQNSSTMDTTVLRVWRTRSFATGDAQSLAFLFYAKLPSTMCRTKIFVRYRSGRVLPSATDGQKFRFLAEQPHAIPPSGFPSICDSWGDLACGSRRSQDFFFHFEFR